jgi:hypothetical protein
LWWCPCLVEIFTESMYPLAFTYCHIRAFPFLSRSIRFLSELATLYIGVSITDLSNWSHRSRFRWSFGACPQILNHATRNQTHYMLLWSWQSQAAVSFFRCN